MLVIFFFFFAFPGGRRMLTVSYELLPVPFLLLYRMVSYKSMIRARLMIFVSLEI